MKLRPTVRKSGKSAFGAVRLEIVGNVGVAEVLPDLEDVVEPMLERVTDRALFELVAVSAGLAEITAVGNTPNGFGTRPATCARHVLLDAVVILVVVVAEDCERGVRGSDAQVKLGAMKTLLSVTKSCCESLIATETDHAVEKLAIPVDRSADVERALKTLERAEGALDLIVREPPWPLADHVDQAARLRLAIKAGRRPAQNLQPLEPVRLDARIGELRALVERQPQPVQIARGIEAAEPSRHRRTSSRYEDQGVTPGV